MLRASAHIWVRPVSVSSRPKAPARPSSGATSRPKTPPSSRASTSRCSSGVPAAKAGRRAARMRTAPARKQPKAVAESASHSSHRAMPSTTPWATAAPDPRLRRLPSYRLTSRQNDASPKIKQLMPRPFLVPETPLYTVMPVQRL
jgi:hypothetical protein